MNERENLNLAELATNCNNCIKSLSKKLKKAEKILILAEMNDKQETEKERVTPFYQNTEFSEEEKKSLTELLEDQV